MFTTAINWLKAKWDSFETWVASWLPGWKTKITTGLGAVGMTAGMLQDYVTGLPLEHLVTAKTLAIVSAVLFTLSYWFKSLGEKAAA